MNRVCEVLEMKDGKMPNPNTVHPIAGYENEAYVKPTATNPNIVVGNPAKVLSRRFDDELVDLLLTFRWRDREIEEINALIPILTCSDLEKAKRLQRCILLAHWMRMRRA